MPAVFALPPTSHLTLEEKMKDERSPGAPGNESKQCKVYFQACTFDCSSAKAEPTDRTGTIEASISTVAEETTIVAIEARGYGRYPLI